VIGRMGVAVDVAATAVLLGAMAVSVALTAACTWLCNAPAVAANAGVGVGCTATAVAVNVGKDDRLAGVGAAPPVQRDTSCVPTKKASSATTMVPIAASVTRFISITSPLVA
jgi:hypothetical protein